MSTFKVQTGLRLDETTYYKLKTLTIRERRTLNNLIDYIIRNYLDDYESQHGEIPEYQDE